MYSTYFSHILHMLHIFSPSKRKNVCGTCGGGICRMLYVPAYSRGPIARSFLFLFLFFRFGMKQAEQVSFRIHFEITHMKRPILPCSANSKKTKAELSDRDYV